MLAAVFAALMFHCFLGFANGSMPLDRPLVTLLCLIGAIGYTGWGIWLMLDEEAGKHDRR